MRERLLNAAQAESARVEACVAAQFARRQPTYYIKAEGEIDLVLVSGKNFTPVEVKWTESLRAIDLAQL